VLVRRPRFRTLLRASHGRAGPRAQKRFRAILACVSSGFYLCEEWLTLAHLKGGESACSAEARRRRDRHVARQLGVLALVASREANTPARVVAELLKQRRAGARGDQTAIYGCAELRNSVVVKHSPSRRVDLQRKK
jgi:hypothetical protein